MSTQSSIGEKAGKTPAGKSYKLPTVCLVPKSISQAVVAVVCDERVYDTAPRMILGARRMGYLPAARFMIVFMLRAVWGEERWSGDYRRAWATWEQIGRVVRREYTTAIYAYEQAERYCRDDPDFRDRLLAALDLLYERMAPRERARIVRVKEKVAAL